MKIAVTSDLHHIESEKDVHRRFADALAALEPDIFLIAGDVGEPFEQFAACLETYSRVSHVRGVIAGNCDLWCCGDGTCSSQRLWDFALVQAASEHGYCWLEKYSMRSGTIGICGTIAWYDYSNAPHTMSEQDIISKKPFLTCDSDLVNWQWSDREFASMVGDAFVRRLFGLNHSDEITDIIAITHMPIFDQYLFKTPMCAFNANLTLGQRMLEYDKLRMVISAHTHIETKVNIIRDGLGILPVWVMPARYGSPQAFIIDTATWTVTKQRAE